MNYTLNAIMLALLMLAIAGGCSQDTAQGGGSHGETHVAIDVAKYLLADEPENAVGVITAREDSKDQDEIVLVGRIGGRKDPWIEGRAAFMMIDAAMAVVADGEESGENEVCMDDCCASLRAECTTLVKIVDEKGKPLPIDARKLLGANENDLVVVTGRVHRDDEGSFSVAAHGVYVRR